MPHAAYDELTAAHLRFHRLEHLQKLADWDRATHMPRNGNEARAAALAEMSVLLHGLRTAPRLGELIERAGDEPLDDAERANLREMKRQRAAATALPESLVQQKALAGARCEHAWRHQRPANDWPGFLQNFREVVRVARAEARRLAAASGLAPYDALLDRWEPGMTTAQIDPLFTELRVWLPA